MHRRSIWTISPVALILASALLPILGAQSAPPKSVDDIHIEKWNSVPLPGPAYAGLNVSPCSAPRPVRSLGRHRRPHERPAGRNPSYRCE